MQIIITLFQKDNIFGIGARCVDKLESAGNQSRTTYGHCPQLQSKLFMIEKFVKIITEDEVSVHRSCSERLPNPTHLEGQVRFVQAKTSRLPNVVRDSKTRSLIKMCVHGITNCQVLQ